MAIEKPHGHNRLTKGRESWNIAESIFGTAKGGNARANLNPHAFSELIEQQGVNVKVYRTSYCPNVKAVDGAEHEIDCTTCNGSGWIDLEPLCTRAILQSIALEKVSRIEGLVDGNTVMMTFPTGIELQYFTLVELQDYLDIFIQRVLRNPVGDVDILKYAACRFNFVVDKNLTRYYQDQDFKIDPNGDILWLSGGTASKPATNTPYSVHYEAKVQFRAVRAAHVNRLAQHKIGNEVEFVKFPENWYLAKEFLLRKNDALTGNELKQGPFDNHAIVS